MPTNKQWLLKHHPSPDEVIGSQHFELVETDIPSIGEGELLVRTLALGTSPAQRAYTVENRRFHNNVKLGEVMHGRGVGVVEQSNDPDFSPGDIIVTSLGWQEWSVQKAGRGPLGTVDVLSIQKADPAIRPTTLHLTAMGNTGLTALYGLENIGELSAGKTVVVSAAAGGVGVIAGQLAKAYGARAIGIAGGPKKCDWIVENAGYEAAIDYKNEDVGAALDRLCPDGVDIFFDSVGGEMLDTVLQRIAYGARVVICGMISTEYLEERPAGPKWYGQLIYQRARMEGFVVWDHVKDHPAMQEKLLGLYQAGKIDPLEDVAHGIESMPDALGGLFTGENMGTRVVRVAADPE